VLCLNGDRDALRADPRRAASNAGNAPSDVPRSTADGASALLFPARKTGWPPYVPATAGPA
jgi:hypothetical protein